MEIHDLSDLIGKYLYEFTVSEDKKKLHLVISDEDKIRYNLTFRAEGDCCSQSWIEDYEFEYFQPENMKEVGNKIEDIEEIDLGSILGLVKSDGKVSFYKTEIMLDHGKLIIEYRNDSNGYYGGSLEFDSCDKIGEENEETN